MLRKFLLVFFSIITLAVLVLAFYGPVYLCNYINAHGEELTGRVVQVGKIRYNLLNGKGSVLDLKMKEKDRKTDFVAIRNVEFNTDLYRLFVREFRLSSLRIDGSYVQLIDSVDGFNFDDLLESDTTSADKPDEGPSKFDILIQNIDFSLLEFLFANSDNGHQFQVKNIKLSLPEILLSRDDMAGGLTAQLSNGGLLQSHSKYNQKTGVYLIDLNLSQVGLKAVEPWMKDYLVISEFNGELDAKIKIKGGAFSPYPFEFSGDAVVNNFIMKDPDSNVLASSEKASFSVKVIDLTAMNFDFGEIALTRPEIFVVNDSSGMNWIKVFETEPDSASVAEAEPLSDTLSSESEYTYRVESFRIENGVFHYRDATLYDEFNYQLSALNLNSNAFFPGSSTRWELNGEGPGGGDLHVIWEGPLDNLENQFLLLETRKLRLEDFSPYSLAYFGYPITKGRMNFVSKNTVVAYQLEGENQINIHDPRLAKEKRKTPKPEYNVPVKLGLYLLKDIDNNVEMDLPVSGRLDDPQFKYSKLIIKALLNVLEKVALSPVKFLAQGMGLDPDKAETIPVTLSQRHISPEQYTQVDNMIKLMQSKPELNGELILHYPLKEARIEKALDRLKLEYYLSMNPSKSAETVDEIEFEKAAGVSEKDTLFEHYVNSRIDPSAHSMSLKDKAAKIHPELVIDPDINRWAERLNGELRSYLKQVNILPDSALKVTTAEPSELDVYKGKPYYKLSLGLSEDE